MGGTIRAELPKQSLSVQAVTQISPVLCCKTIACISDPADLDPFKATSSLSFPVDHSLPLVVLFCRLNVWVGPLFPSSVSKFTSISFPGSVIVTLSCCWARGIELCVEDTTATVERRTGDVDSRVRAESTAPW